MQLLFHPDNQMIRVVKNECVFVEIGKFVNGLNAYGVHANYIYIR